MAMDDVAATLTSGIPHQTCGACYALSQMSNKDAAKLRALLSDKRVKMKPLAAAMCSDPETPDVEWQALARHARGGCSAKENLR